MYVKVMTDEQLETLRKQIAVYGTICDQLIEMHRTLSAQQDLAGPYFLPLLFFCLCKNYQLCFLLNEKALTDKVFTIFLSLILSK